MIPCTYKRGKHADETRVDYTRVNGPSHLGAFSHERYSQLPTTQASNQSPPSILVFWEKTSLEPPGCGGLGPCHQTATMGEMGSFSIKRGANTMQFKSTDKLLATHIQKAQRHWPGLNLIVESRFPPPPYPLLIGIKVKINRVTVKIPPRMLNSSNNVSSANLNTFNTQVKAWGGTLPLSGACDQSRALPPVFDTSHRPFVTGVWPQP